MQPCQTDLSEIVDEITMHRELHHPNIVSFLGYEKSEKCLRIFMEQVPGGSLFELINVRSARPRLFLDTQSRQT